LLISDYRLRDIVASAPLEITKTQESKNLQALLIERFKLVAHQETRDFPVYALVLARPLRTLIHRVVHDFAVNNRQH
jgi:uncharacterized protein (TIGR03435 family)